MGRLLIAFLSWCFGCFWSNLSSITSVTMQLPGKCDDFKFWCSLLGIHRAFGLRSSQNFSLWSVCAMQKHSIFRNESEIVVGQFAYIAHSDYLSVIRLIRNCAITVDINMSRRLEFIQKQNNFAHEKAHNEIQTNLHNEMI